MLALSALAATAAVHMVGRSGTGVKDDSSAADRLAASASPHAADNTSTLAHAAPTRHCGRRREWRTLSAAEQAHYIASVQCLQRTPSALGHAAAGGSATANATAHAYDDFPYVHAQVGRASHNAAPFLPWHRRFLAVYERTLRDACGFRGEGLVYWDWTLDWRALQRAPVFDAVGGFGGDGQVGGEVVVGNTGRCVTDGPFAGATARWYDREERPHCLARGFRDEAGELGVMDGSALSPESIDQVLRHADYEALVKEMESRIHDAIPFGIGGDFETFTAPYGESVEVGVPPDTKQAH